jgi:hypothetical protein
MAVTRDLLNKVLVGLRKDEIAAATTAVTSTYHKLLLQLINTAKENIEDAWDWHTLKTTVTVTGVGGQAAYTLLAANEADVNVGERSRLLYQRRGQQSGWIPETSVYYTGNLPQVYDTTDSAEFRLWEVTQEEMERLHFTDDDQTVSKPDRFALYRDEDNVFFKVWPTPTGIRTWKLRFVIPQAELTAADITTTLSLPAFPVWTRALTLANAERGEELGAPTSVLGLSADDALHDAIARERTDEEATSYPE